jgi:hypothetical protein
MPWNSVQGLCSQYKAEAVVALEIFDSNFIITKGERMKKQTVDETELKKK